MKAAILSIYLDNIPSCLVDKQALVVEKYLPRYVDFYQTRSVRHAVGIDDFLRSHVYDVYLILDIDCIPLNNIVLPWMLETASSDILVGCAQRANHIENGEHIYAGPCPSVPMFPGTTSYEKLV